MTDIPPTARDVAPSSGFSAAQVLRSIGFSIVFNAVFPYLIYRILEPRFPPGSLTPLLASTAFPLMGLMFALVRKKSVDYIAIIALAEISISIVVTLVAANVRFALMARALQGSLTGLFFFGTILIGRPIIYYIARQFVAASSPGILAGFEAVNQRDQLKTFRMLTALWGTAIILVSLVNLALAATVAPANYLFFAPVISTATNIVLLWFSIRHSSSRLRRLA